MGASGANSTPAFFARLFNATLGTKMKVIAGYPGQNERWSPWSAARSTAIRACFTARCRRRGRPGLRTAPRARSCNTARQAAELNGVPFVPDLVNGADKLLLEAAFAPLSSAGRC